MIKPSILRTKLMPKVFQLYWHHLPEHTDPSSEGYIGVSSQILIRTNTHRYWAASYAPKLRQAYEEHGDCIQVDVLHEGTQQEMLTLEYEYRPKYYIGWNITKGGGTTPDCTGRTHSDETKQKISRSNAGKNLGQVSPFKGLTDRWTKEQKEKIGSYHKGKTISEAHKATITKKNSGSGNYQSQQITMYHIDTPEIERVFVNYREAAEMLELKYSSLREQGRKRLGKPNKAGWVVKQVGQG